MNHHNSKKNGCERTRIQDGQQLHCEQRRQHVYWARVRDPCAAASCGTEVERPLFFHGNSRSRVRLRNCHRNTYKESRMYQVRVVHEEIEATVPKEAKVCIGWTGLKHWTTKDRGRGKTMVSFWFSTLDRHHDGNGLESGET